MDTKYVRNQATRPVTTPMRRRLFAAITALALAGTAIASTTAPASASTEASAGAQVLVQVTCTGREDVTYSPGITNTPALVTITTSAQYVPCLHINGLNVTTMSGEASSQSQTMAACTEVELPDGESTTSVIEWSNGQTSTWEYTTTTQNVAGNYVTVGIGQITDGLYEGALAQRELVLPGLVEALQACATPQGMTGVSGAFTFTITGI
jgi:hypothetical protein